MVICTLGWHTLQFWFTIDPGHTTELRLPHNTTGSQIHTCTHTHTHTYLSLKVLDLLLVFFDLCYVPILFVAQVHHFTLNMHFIVVAFLNFRFLTAKDTFIFLCLFLQMKNTLSYTSRTYVHISSSLYFDMATAVHLQIVSLFKDINTHALRCV